MMGTQENYTKSIDGVARLLGMLDRNPVSQTYGCFDRNYWHYKAASDFPSATYQQGVYSLALAYQHQFDGNIYYRDETILEYIAVGIRFWTDIQNRDGSFNEWFPYEHSYVATAFTTYSITETMLLIGGEIRSRYPDIFERALETVRRAGLWLVRHKDTLTANHTVGAVVALYDIFLLTKGEYFKRAAEDALAALMKLQDEEGWFAEYGGADPGYLSVTIDFLAKYYLKTKDVSIKAPLEKALNFLSFCIHPDGTSGGEYGSRNTQYIFTAGLEILKDDFPKAAEILAKFHASPCAFDASMADDRYFVFFFLPNYLESFCYFASGKTSKALDEPFDVYFEHAGIVSIKNKNFHIVVNIKKNGITKIFDTATKALLYDDAGYAAAFEDGKTATSQWLNGCGSSLQVLRGKDVSITCSGPFVYVREQSVLCRWLVLFRFFNYTFGRSDFIMNIFNTVLKKYFIKNAPCAPLCITKKIIISDNMIEISESVEKATSRPLLSFEQLSGISLLHVPSSRYFIPRKLSIPHGDSDEMLEVLNRENRLSVSLVFSWKGPHASVERRIHHTPS